MALHKRKAPAQFQDEGFQLAQDGGFQISFVMALAQAQKVEEVRVFEDQGGIGVTGFDLLSPNGCGGLQGGKLCALDLVAQLTHTPSVGGGLAGVKLACRFGFER